jgi:hypothetical protein
MPGVQVSVAGIKRHLSDDQRRDVDAHLAAGQGVALYADERGRATVLVTFGTRDSDFPGLPPGLWGGGELHSFVPAPKQAQPMKSPLKAAMEDQGRIPQIAAPPRSSTVTSYPEVLISGRTSNHPRGDRGGYIDVERLLPDAGREPEAPTPPPAPLTEDAAWWARQLSGR